MLMLHHSDAIVSRYEYPDVDYSASVVLLEQVQVARDGRTVNDLEFRTKTPMEEFKGMTSDDFALENVLLLGNLDFDSPNYLSARNFSVIDKLNSL